MIQSGLARPPTAQQHLQRRRGYPCRALKHIDDISVNAMVDMLEELRCARVQIQEVHEERAYMQYRKERYMLELEK